MTRKQNRYEKYAIRLILDGINPAIPEEIKGLEKVIRLIKNKKLLDKSLRNQYFDAIRLDDQEGWGDPTLKKCIDVSNKLREYYSKFPIEFLSEELETPFKYIAQLRDRKMTQKTYEWLENTSLDNLVFYFGEQKFQRDKQEIFLSLF